MSTKDKRSMGMVQYITELDGNILLLIQEFLR